MSEKVRVQTPRQRSAPPTASPVSTSVSRSEDSDCGCGGSGHDIRRVALSVNRSLQRAMSVSQPGDPSEVEADRVADEVMRMPSAPDKLSRTAETVSRDEVPEEEEMQAKRIDRSAIQREDIPEEEELQTKRESIARAPSSDVESGADVSSVVSEGLSGGGQPLDSSTRAFMEPRLGQDLSNIRVHTGAAASQSAEAVSARAYAVGNHIAFKDGEYNLGTSAGRHLLAHELTHTVQQGATKPIERKADRK